MESLNLWASLQCGHNEYISLSLFFSLDYTMNLTLVVGLLKTGGQTWLGAQVVTPNFDTVQSPGG